MTQTLTRSVSTHTRKTATAYVVSAVAMVAGMLLLATFLADGPRADVTIANDSAWDLRVDAVYADGGVVPLAKVEAERTQTILDVWEPSGAWQFRWTYGSGTATETVTVSHDDLRTGDGRISPPADLTAQLRADGVAPSQ